MPPPSHIPPEFADAFGMLFNTLFTLPSPKRTGFNRDSIDNLEVVDRLLPTSTLYFFLDFIFEGNLYSGAKTTLALIVEDEVSLFGKRYADWAPAPWNREPTSLESRMLNSPDRFHVTVSCKISCMRARLWEGMVPMSGARWKEKKLDDPKDWQLAFEFLSDVVKTFVWLGDTTIVRGIKDSFNYIARELGVFQDALNARRAQNGVDARVDLKALWLEFMTDLFETMVGRTYGWLHDRFVEIIAKGKAEYEAIADAKGAANASEDAKKFLACWADLYKVHNCADFVIMMPLDGFTGFPAPRRNYSKAVGSMLPPPLRQAERNEIAAQLPWPHSERALENPEAFRRCREGIDSLVQEMKQNYEYMRREQRGEPKTLGREHWITILHSRTEWSLAHGGPSDQKWGFVVYMLTHTPSKEEWETFKSKLYADFSRSGEWVEGFGEIKENMGLQWIDGKEVGLPHDDVEAAKRHFKTFSISNQMRRRAWRQDFFVIDTASYASYMDPPSAFQARAPYGDYGGFFTLIDTMTYNPQLIHETAPGFQNKLRILGSLVFDDVYPLIVSLVQRPRHLWPLAMRHPNQVYVGYPVDGQEKAWDEVWTVRGVWWRCFWKWRGEAGGNGAAAS